MSRYTVVDVPQRSPAWFAARLGRLTGSNADDIFKEGRTKGSESVHKRDLRIRLACERIVGTCQEDDFKVSAEIQRGIDKEPEAFDAYEVETGNIGRKVGFLAHELYMAGCSPDGLVGSVGLLEVKCPKSATHLGYLRAGVLPAAYVPQVRHNLWISGAEWCDFISFDDRFPVPLFVVRVQASQMDIPGYEAAALAFLADVEAECAAVRALAIKAA